MSKQREALQMALNALSSDNPDIMLRASVAIREALAEQEPVAWMCADEELSRKGYSRFSRNCEGEWNIPVYTTPPTSKPLTDREITSLMVNHDFDSTYRDRIHSLIRAVELVHGIGGEE